MMYETECWASYIKMEQAMSVAEMRRSRCMSGITREERIINKYIKGYVSSIGVMISIEDKV